MNKPGNPNHTAAMKAPQPKKIETRGRKPTGRTRTASMPKICPAAYLRLKQLADHQGISIAAAVEVAIDKMHKRIA